MRIDARGWIAGLLLVFFAAGALMAQEEETPPPAEPPEEPPQEEAVARPMKMFVELDMWYMQPVGTEYFVATEHNPGSSLETRVWDVAHGADWRPRYRLGYALDNGAGEFLGSYFSQDEQVDLTRSSPGNFVFGEIQAFQHYAGVFDDGLADAFEARTRTKIREWRIDFARSFLQGPRVRAKWLVGWREVNHLRQMEVDYFALNPSPDLFPPPLPPPSDAGPSLLPLPDETVNASTYGGRGPEVGVEFVLPFGKGEKFAVEAGATYAVLRGDLLQSYASFTGYYYTVNPLDPDYVSVILVPPYDEFIDPDDIRVKQCDPSTGVGCVTVGVQVATAQVSGSVLDAHLGFRWKVWKELEVLGGFRSSSYDNVGAFVIPAGPAPGATGTLNFETLEQKNLRVLYEGFYAGVAYRY